MRRSRYALGKIDLTKTLTPEEKFEIITRNLQVGLSELDS